MDAKKNFRVPPALGVFLCSLVLDCLFNYGGIRSPDAEVVFRTGLALVTRGAFTVDAPLETWPGFGTPTGRDGRRYSIFGPAEPVAAAPLIAVALAVNRTGWYAGDFYLPPSLYLPGGLSALVAGTPLPDREPHALRFLASFFNPLVSALAAAVFFLCARTLAGSDRPALVAAALYAAGSLALPYSGTFFSEPLTVLFLLLALRPLLRLDPDLSPAPLRAALPSALAGLCLGAAVTAHLSAILFAPFLGIWLAISVVRRDRRRAAAGIAAFSAGLGLMLGLLALHNWLRFGDALETGRNVGDTSAFAYGAFAWSWTNLSGLLFSPGKGLFIYCPAVILAAFGGREFFRRAPTATALLTLAIITRLIFFAGRDDWHGGFSLGPRYLVPVVPLLLLPLAFFARRVLAGPPGRRVALFAASSACLAQQVFLSLGEVFSYSTMLLRHFQAQGVDLFTGYRLYFDWSLAPALHLLEGRRGPFFLHSVALGNQSLWLLLSSVLIIGLALLFFSRNGTMKEETAPSPAAPGGDQATPD